MLIGNGIRYSPRSGLLNAGSVAGAVPVVRPVWSGINHRQMFDKDYTSFPSGAQEGSIVLSLKYGGMGMHETSTATVSAEVSAWGDVADSITGLGTASGAITGLKDSPCYIYGTGYLTGSEKGTGTISCSISIGAQPSAFDIAQAVWGMDNGIETGWTPRQVMRIVAAVLAGEVSGAGSFAPQFKSITGDSTRVSAETDASGNRTVVTTYPG